MSAEVIEFSLYARRRTPHVRQPSRAAAPRSAHDFMFWTGATGRTYVHTIHGLITCPEVPNSVYVLVRRRADGTREPIYVGRVERDAPSLNLAEIRQTAALLEANEVHVHLLARSPLPRIAAESDLAAALIDRGTLHRVVGG